MTESEIVAILKTHLRLWQLFTLDGQYDKTIIKPESLEATARAIHARTAAALAQIAEIAASSPDGDPQYAKLDRIAAIAKAEAKP